MAANHHYCTHTDVHTELCSALSRVATIMTCDRDRCDRERQEHLSSIRDLTARLTTLQTDLQVAQATAQAAIAAQTNLQNLLNESELRKTQLTADCDGLKDDLAASQDKVTALQDEVDNKERIIVDTAREMKKWERKCGAAERDLIVANQAAKTARKKMKKLCGMLKEEDDESSVGGSPMVTRRGRRSTTRGQSRA